MVPAIKKLIENIDQLVFWLKENPKVRMPLQEKQRAIIILNKIINAEEISNEEWEKMSPKQKPINSNFLATFGQRKKIEKKETEIKKNNAFNSNVPLPLRPPITKTIIEENNFIIKNGRKLIVCKSCNTPLLEKNLAKHKKNVSLIKKAQLKKNIKLSNHTTALKQKNKISILMIDILMDRMAFTFIEKMVGLAHIPHLTTWAMNHFLKICSQHRFGKIGTGHCYFGFSKQSIIGHWPTVN